MACLSRALCAIYKYAANWWFNPVYFLSVLYSIKIISLINNLRANSNCIN